MKTISSYLPSREEDPSQSRLSLTTGTAELIRDKLSIKVSLYLKSFRILGRALSSELFVPFIRTSGALKARTFWCLSSKTKNTTIRLSIHSCSLVDLPLETVCFPINFTMSARICSRQNKIVACSSREKLSKSFANLQSFLFIETISFCWMRQMVKESQGSNWSPLTLLKKATSSSQSWKLFVLLSTPIWDWTVWTRPY